MYTKHSTYTHRLIIRLLTTHLTNHLVTDGHGDGRINWRVGRKIIIVGRINEERESKKIHVNDKPHQGETKLYRLMRYNY